MLLVDCHMALICQWPYKATMYFCCCYFLCGIFAAPSKETTPPHTFCHGRLDPTTHVLPWSPCLTNTPLTVDAPPSNGSHLRPRVHPFLYYLLIHLPPQTTGYRPSSSIIHTCSDLASPLLQCQTIISLLCFITNCTHLRHWPRPTSF